MPDGSPVPQASTRIPTRARLTVSIADTGHADAWRAQTTGYFEPIVRCPHRRPSHAPNAAPATIETPPLPAEQPADALWWRITRHLHLDNPTHQNQATTTETPHPTPVLLPGDLAALLAQASGRNKTHHETHTRPTPQAPPR